MTHLELIALNYLLNLLWQVPLIYFVAALAARLTKSAGPQIEHRIWVAALLLEAALPTCAFAPRLGSIFFALFRNGSGHVTTQTTILNVTAVQSHSNLTAITAFAALLAYAAALLFVSGRLLYRLHRTRSLRHASQIVTLSGDSLAIWQRCARAFAVHDAQLATSTGIAGPSTIGVRHRIVLLPPTLLTDFPQEDFAAALAHEFAHMRRRDFAKNLLYELIALPIAWHPLLWLTRLRIAESREMLCDELAAHATHGTTRYAHSLLRLAESFSRPAPASTLHAIGILDANVLERRVMKLSRNHSITAASSRLSITIAVLLGVATCASAMTLRIEVPARAIIHSRAVIPARAFIAYGKQQTNGPARVSAAVMAGQVISKVNPIYPPTAKASGIGGTVVLHAIIGKDGTVQQLAVISGPSVLAGSAMDAVKQWVYEPFLLNGEPTEVETTVTVNYSLGEQKTPSASPQQPDNTSEAAPKTEDPQAAVYNIGGPVRPPVVIYSRDPEYTEAARKAKLSGNVVLSLIVDSAGEPQNVRVARGLGNELDEKAIEAVQQYRFKPATKNGDPVAVALNVEVNFRIF